MAVSELWWCSAVSMYNISPEQFQLGWYMKPAWEDFKNRPKFWDFFLLSFKFLKASPEAFTEHLNIFFLARQEFAMAISLQGLCRWAAQIAKVMCVHHYLPGFTWIALQCWLCLKQNTKCDCSLNWAVWEGFRARGWLWRWDGHGDPPLHRINLPPEQGVGSRLFPQELFCKECVGWGSWV